MSTTNIYDYVHGQTFTASKLKQEASGTGIVYLKDEYTDIPLAYTSLRLFNDSAGTIELVLDTDFTIEQNDIFYTAEESVDVFRGYQIINATYQGVAIYADADIVGNYTRQISNHKYIELSSNETITLDKQWKHCVIVANTGCTQVTIDKTSLVNESNKVLVFNDSGGVCTLTDGTLNYTLNDGQNQEFYYRGASLKTGSIDRASAYVNFNGLGVVAIREEMNVSSITDHGTGDYSANFENDMDNNNYTRGGMVGEASSNNNVLSMKGRASADKTISACRIVCYFANPSSSGIFDPSFADVVFFGGR